MDETRDGETREIRAARGARDAARLLWLEGVVHDLASPLGALGFNLRVACSLADELPADEKVAELREILSDLMRVAEVTSQMSGDLRLYARPTNLETSSVCEVVETVRRLCHATVARRASLEITCPPELVAPVGPPILARLLVDVLLSLCADLPAHQPGGMRRMTLVASPLGATGVSLDVAIHDRPPLPSAQCAALRELETAAVTLTVTETSGSIRVVVAIASVAP